MCSSSLCSKASSCQNLPCRSLLLPYPVLLREWLMREWVQVLLWVLLTTGSICVFRSSVTSDSGIVTK